MAGLLTFPPKLQRKPVPKRDPASSKFLGPGSAAHPSASLRAAPRPGNEPSPVMRHAERRFAALEDQRHDQILLVVEMADQALEQRAARLRIGLAAAHER